MEIYNKKTSVFKATKKNADAASKTLLEAKTKKGNPVFTRVEVPNGFEINGKRKVNGVWVDCTIFRYTNDNGRKLIEWDSEVITLD